MAIQEVFRFEFEQGEELMDALNDGQGITPELSRNMARELNDLLKNSESVLTVDTEATKTVTIFLTPQYVVEVFGSVLITTFDDQRVVSMVSKEFIEATAVRHNEAEDQDLAQTEWNLLLGLSVSIKTSGSVSKVIMTDLITE
jgi:hypothetical protein